MSGEHRTSRLPARWSTLEPHDSPSRNLADAVGHTRRRVCSNKVSTRKRTELFWPVIACDLSGQGQKALAFSAGQNYSPWAGKALILRWQLWAMAVWYVEK